MWQTCLFLAYRTITAPQILYKLFKHCPTQSAVTITKHETFFLNLKKLSFISS